jgi:hypothetical protein
MSGPPKEKSAPAERISQDARCEATPTATSSTEVWMVVAQDQPEDILAIRPKRSTRWRDTLQHSSKPRWQTNGRHREGVKWA